MKNYIKEFEQFRGEQRELILPETIDNNDWRMWPALYLAYKLDQKALGE